MASVKKFGALGDGKADDTGALRRAVSEGDGLLEFPRGEYRITRPIEINLAESGKTSVHGGGGTAAILMDGPGPALCLRGTHKGTAGPEYFRPEEWRKERMPMISNIEIAGIHPDADGIRIEGVMQPVLSGLLIREVNTGIHLCGLNRNVLIDRCHIYHNKKSGIHLDRLNLHQACITGSHISYCRMGGIRVEASEIRNLQITGNDIEYNNARAHEGAGEAESADVCIDVREGTVREGAITGNTIQATCFPGGANIRFIGKGVHDDAAAGLFSIAGNLIGNQENNIHITGACGIAIAGNCIYRCRNRSILIENSRSIAIGANVFEHPAYQSAEYCPGVRLSDSSNCSICGLVMQDFRNTGPAVQKNPREALLELIRCRKITLQGAHLLDGFPYGLMARDCEDTIVSGCIIKDERDERRMLAPVLWDGEGPGCMLSGCRLGAPAGEAVNGGGRLVVKDNLFDI